MLKVISSYHYRVKRYIMKKSLINCQRKKQKKRAKSAAAAKMKLLVCLWPQEDGAQCPERRLSALSWYFEKSFSVVLGTTQPDSLGTFFFFFLFFLFWFSIVKNVDSTWFLILFWYHLNRGNKWAEPILKVTLFTLLFFVCFLSSFLVSFIKATLRKQLCIYNSWSVVCTSCKVPSKSNSLVVQFTPGDDVMLSISAYIDILMQFG